MQMWQYILIAALVGILFISAIIFLTKKKSKNISSNVKTTNSNKFIDGEISDKLITLLGGITNISSLNYCKTRIKIDLKNRNLASFDNDDYVNNGVAGIISRGGDKIDIIIGFEVEEVAKQIQSKLQK